MRLGIGLMGDMAVRIYGWTDGKARKKTGDRFAEEEGDGRLTLSMSAPPSAGNSNALETHEASLGAAGEWRSRLLRRIVRRVGVQ